MMLQVIILRAPDLAAEQRGSDKGCYRPLVSCSLAFNGVLFFFIWRIASCAVCRAAIRHPTANHDATNGALQLQCN